MRILILSMNYAPELVGVGKFSGEMATWLAARGHEVRAVCAPPYYPAWRVGEGYSAWRYRRERLGGVEVRRCPLWVPSRPTGWRRLLHLAGFAAAAAPALLAQALWRPEVVVVTEPPLACAPLALLCAGLSGAAAWLHVQDLEIEAAFGLGLLPAGLLRRAALGLEGWLLGRFERVSTISEAMRAHLSARGVAAARLVPFPNWVDTQAVRPLTGASPLRSALGIPPGAVVALYSGSMGEKQGLEVVIQAAGLLLGHPGLLFVLCGQGAARERLEARACGLPNVRFLPLQPAERLGDLLGLADLHLLPQRAGAADLVMPSKLAAMLASGRPVVATAAAGTELERAVAPCGLVVPPGEPARLAEALAGLAGRPQERARLGRVARRLAEERWSKEIVLAEFERRLIECAGHVAGQEKLCP